MSELTTAVTVAYAARTAATATAQLTPLKGGTYAEPRTSRVTFASWLRVGCGRFGA